MRDLVEVDSRLGVVLSAGGVHSAGFLSALHALNDNGYINSIHALSGNSGGAMNAAILASEIASYMSENGYPKNFRALLDKGLKQAQKAWIEAGADGQLFNALSGHCIKNPFFASAMSAGASMTSLFRPNWHATTLGKYVDVDAVAEGHIPVYIGASERKVSGHEERVFVNDVRPTTIAASASYDQLYHHDGMLLKDGGHLKAAIISRMIEEAGCNKLLVIGETSEEAHNIIPMHQTEAMIASGDSHATSHLERHVAWLANKYPEVEFLYLGVPFPNCDASRTDISMRRVRDISSYGYEIGTQWGNEFGSLISEPIESVGVKRVLG